MRYGTDHNPGLHLTLQPGGQQVSYHQFGSGPELMICLHGYGENGSAFSSLEPLLGQLYTLVCPDLPLHGATRWNQPAMDLTDMDNLLQALSRQVAGQSRQVEGLPVPFALMGYSMGGRLAMAYAEQFPHRLSHLFLLAPDGLGLNFWYWLATQTGIGNTLFRFTMRHPDWLFEAMELGKYLGLINQSIYKFSHHFLDDPLQRKLLYERWTFFRLFRPRINRLQQAIRRHHLPTDLFFGKFDRIITANQAGPFKSLTGGPCRVFLLEAGHRLLKPPNAITIADKILERQNREPAAP